jgi:hypothetical protein
LAFVSSILMQDGYLIPSGMTSSFSLLQGVTETMTMIRVDDPKLFEQAAAHWFMSEHKKARFVSVALDCHATVDGSRTDAIALSARFADFSDTVLVFNPYSPRTDTAPIRFHEPKIDFPQQSAHLFPKHDLVLAGVIKGRNDSPLHKLNA